MNKIGHDDLKNWKVNMMIIMKSGYGIVMEKFIEKLLSQQKLDTLDEVKHSLITQIKELQEEPTREGVIDIIKQL